MRRVIFVVLITLAALACGRPATAGWNEFWHQFHLDYQRGKAWPDPFRHADREVQRAPFAIMVHNGWRLNNTIGHELFDRETQELNEAGWRRVRWIVTQAPPHRRSVYVLRADSPDATQVRFQSVQQSVAAIVGPGPVPPVLLTDREPTGVSGDYVDQVDRKIRSSVPAPILPQMTGDGTGN